MALVVLVVPVPALLLLPLPVLLPVLVIVHVLSMPLTLLVTPVWLLPLPPLALPPAQQWAPLCRACLPTRSPPPADRSPARTALLLLLLLWCEDSQRR